jgi:hypothetical protein
MLIDFIKTRRQFMLRGLFFIRVAAVISYHIVLVITYVPSTAPLMTVLRFYDFLIAVTIVIIDHAKRFLIPALIFASTSQLAIG